MAAPRKIGSLCLTRFNLIVQNYLKLRPLAAKTNTLVLLVHLINFLGGSSSDPLKVTQVE